MTDPLAGVSGYDYAFTPENRMTKVRTRKLASGNAYDGARILQEAEYGPDGNRWLKIVAGSITGGDAMLTLRDASGQVAVDFMETNDGQGPRASKHYVYGSGRLLAQYSACGPAPQLTVDSMTGTSITFEKLDAAGETWTDHYVVIQDDTGETVKLIGPIENLADTFSVLRSEFSGGGNFVVRVRGESGCGSSGFSNGVTVNLDAAAGSCLDGVALGNWGIDSGTGDATLRMRAHHTCPAGTVFRAVYAQTYMPGFPALVLEAGLSSPAANIEDTGLTSGLGWDYWFEAHDSGGTPEGDPGMRTTKENWNAYNVAGHAADEASLHVEYLHSDHLGSTRLVTEALGSAVASLKFYPFGHLAEVATPGASDGVRMQFTGHERDASIGLDYMKARYCGPGLGRFLSVDPVVGKPDHPESWNRYAYVRNRPVISVDPNGRTAYLVVRETTFGGAHAFVVVFPNSKSLRDSFRGDQVFDSSKGNVRMDASKKTDGNLGGDLNHPYDQEANQAGLAILHLDKLEPPVGMTVEEFDQALVDAFVEYQDNLPYHGIPYWTNGYNSNGFASGLIEAAGGKRPKLPGIVGAVGWNKPVPKEHFSPSTKGRRESVPKALLDTQDYGYDTAGYCSAEHGGC